MNACADVLCAKTRFLQLRYRFIQFGKQRFNRVGVGAVVRRNEAALARRGEQHAVRLQLAVGALDGIRIHGKRLRQLAHRRKLAACRQLAAYDSLPQRGFNLLINRTRVAVIDLQHSLTSNCTNCDNTVIHRSNPFVKRQIKLTFVVRLLTIAALGNTIV